MHFTELKKLLLKVIKHKDYKDELQGHSQKKFYRGKLWTFTDSEKHENMSCGHTEYQMHGKCAKFKT